MSGKHTPEPKPPGQWTRESMAQWSGYDPEAD